MVDAHYVEKCQMPRKNIIIMFFINPMYIAITYSIIIGSLLYYVIYEECQMSRKHIIIICISLLHNVAYICNMYIFFVPGNSLNRVVSDDQSVPRDSIWKLQSLRQMCAHVTFIFVVTSFVLHNGGQEWFVDECKEGPVLLLADGGQPRKVSRTLPKDSSTIFTGQVYYC